MKVSKHFVKEKNSKKYKWNLLYIREASRLKKKKEKNIKNERKHSLN
jgi:hypothetical protein